MTQWHTLQQDWGENQTRRRNEGEEGREKKSGAGCAPKNQGEKQRGKRGAGERGEGGATMEKRVHLTSARMCSSHATMPCCCVRSGGGWLSCASMSMPMRGNVIHGISCHHHHDELFVCQCVLQPAIPVCVCLCVQRARQCRQQQESTHPKKKKRECVCG